MKRTLAQRYQTWKEAFFVDPKTLFLTVGLYWKNEFKSQKRSLKSFLIRAISYLLVFGVLCYLFKLFFALCARLNIFSVFSFIPLSVVSLMSMAVYWLGFIPALASLLHLLYDTEGSKGLFALPSNSNTLFFSHIVFVLARGCLKTILIEVPFVFGFMLNAGYPWPFFFLAVLGWFLLIVFEVAVLSLLSFPAYYLVTYFKKHPLSRTLASLLVLSLAAYFAFYLLSLVPDHISIFAHWGTYFVAIQKTLGYYMNHFTFSYGLTQLVLGDYDGYRVIAFGGASLTMLGILLGTILGCFFLGSLLAHRFYFAFLSDHASSCKSRSESIPKQKAPSFLMAQLHKEAALLIKDPSIFLSLLAIFLFLPIYISFLNKIFGAMDTNAFGKLLIHVFNVFILLLVALNANYGIANDYLSESRSLDLMKSYPRRADFLLLSKLILPSLIGSLSLLISLLYYCHLQGFDAALSGGLCLALLCFYWGHLLFAAGLGFSHPTKNFSEDQEEEQNLKWVVLSAFLLAILVSLGYFLALGDDYHPATWKLLGAGLLFLGANVLLTVRKIAYCYEEKAA